MAISAAFIRRPKLSFGLVVALTATLLAVVVGKPAGAAGAPYLSQINFQRETGVSPPSGYLRDWGQAYDATRGYGWVDIASTTPKDMSAYSRIRNSTDPLLGSFVSMQPSTTVQARWLEAVPNGSYDVTVAVGDPSYTDSVHRLTVNGTLAIDNFVPAAGSLNKTVTATVSVTGGYITVDPTGGTNTKIDYLQISANDSSTTPIDPNPDYVAQINFQRETGVTPPTGFLRDWGQAYDATRGYGWIQAAATTPLDMTAWGRVRNSTDPLLGSFVHMQPNATTTARWRYAVANGSYTITVGVGDSNYIDSVDKVTVNGTVAINNFVPTTATHNKVASVAVTVSDGFITLDPVGGTNTKLDYIQIINRSPRFVSSTPADGAAGVDRSASIILNPNVSLDPSTVDATSFVVRDSSNVIVPGTYNSDAAGGVATYTPNSELNANSSYSFSTNANLKDLNGVSFSPYTAKFTTGSGGVTVAPFTFTKTVFASYAGVTSMTFGPDGKLYWATATGTIYRSALNANGTPNGAVENLGGWTNTSLITSITFDPAATASNLKLWVSRGYLGFDDVPNFTGYLSVLTGPALATQRDVVSGLPRSVHDHMNNGIKFGPDGKLYMAVGALQGYGAADNYWGDRPETPLSAAILVMDVDHDAAFASTLDVTTAPTGTYDPLATNAPVKPYANGVRNAFDLMWASNGNLYAVGNESTGGNTPAGPGGVPKALAALPPYNDYFTKIVAGGYYGHPNPSIGKYVLNGGNPTSGTDYFEVPGYPVGTQPDLDWVPPLVDFGVHRSPDGISEFKSSVFGAQYKGMFFATEYSAGDDLLALFPDAAGNITSTAQVATGFHNPIQVISNPTTGATYVAEYGSQPDGIGGQIDLLTPNAPAPPALPFTNSFSAGVAGTLADNAGVGTGFDDVLPNTVGSQYVASGLAVHASASTLGITSAAGTFVGTTNTQTDAVRKVFDDSSLASVTATTTLLSPTNLRTSGNAQGIYYGADQDNLVTAQLENTNGNLRLAAYLEQGGTRQAIGSIALRNIVGNVGRVTGITFSLVANVNAATVTVQYQVNTSNGTTALQTLGTSPAVSNRALWFSSSAGAGLYVQQSTGRAFEGLFDSISITGA